MRVREAANRLEVSPATVYALIAAGKLKCSRIGLGRGCIRVQEEQLREFLHGATAEKAAPAAPAVRAGLRHIKLG